MSHSWPGNLRELHNAADRFVLGIADEPFEVRTEGGANGLGDQVASFERSLIAAELRRNKGSVPATSGALGVPIKTLYDKLRRLKIPEKS
jgi:two-component system, NtrC family, C4-dicarboxylate transport response regulator DctD